MEKTGKRFFGKASQGLYRDGRRETKKQKDKAKARAFL